MVLALEFYIEFIIQYSAETDATKILNASIFSGIIIWLNDNFEIFFILDLLKNSEQFIDITDKLNLGRAFFYWFLDFWFFFVLFKGMINKYKATLNETYVFWENLVLAYGTENYLSLLNKIDIWVFNGTVKNQNIAKNNYFRFLIV